MGGAFPLAAFHSGRGTAAGFFWLVGLGRHGKSASGLQIGVVFDGMHGVSGVCGKEIGERYNWTFNAHTDETLSGYYRDMPEICTE